MSWAVPCAGCGDYLPAPTPRPVRRPLCPSCSHVVARSSPRRRDHRSADHRMRDALLDVDRAAATATPRGALPGRARNGHTSTRPLLSGIRGTNAPRFPASNEPDNPPLTGEPFLKP